MTAAVFDADAIRARRLELFPAVPERVDYQLFDRERFGTLKEHCGICPVAPGDNCSKNCADERGALKDGVTVS